MTEYEIASLEQWKRFIKKHPIKRYRDSYDPFNYQIDVILGKTAVKTKTQLQLLMRDAGLHDKKGRNLMPSDLQLSYAWDYVKREGRPVIAYVPREYETIVRFRRFKRSVVRDKRTGRFVKWL